MSRALLLLGSPVRDHATKGKLTSSHAEKIMLVQNTRKLENNFVVP